MVGNRCRRNTWLMTAVVLLFQVALPAEGPPMLMGHILHDPAVSRTVIDHGVPVKALLQWLYVWGWKGLPRPYRP